MLSNAVRRYAPFVLLCALFSLEAPAVFAITYHVTDLGNGYGYSINASGDVAGEHDTGGYDNGAIYHGVLFHAGQTTDLGALSTGEYSVAEGVNDSDQVVGWSQTAPKSTQTAFLYSNDGIHSLGALPGDTESGAEAINNSGQITGFSGIRAFLYSGGSMSPLGVPSGSIGAKGLAINSSGQVAGLTYIGILDSHNQNETHSYLYANGTAMDIGTLPGDVTSEATAINSSGVVTGWSAPNTYDATGFLMSHAYIYSNGKMTDLGTAFGDATMPEGINSSGQIVGIGVTGYYARGFIYSQNKFTDLDTLLDPSSSGYTIDEAYSINDSGQIAGFGSTPGGQLDALLLTPVPEPCTATLLMLTFARCLTGRKRA